MDDIDNVYKFVRKIWGTNKSNIWLCQEKLGSGNFVVAKEIFKSRAMLDPGQVWAERDCLEFLSFEQQYERIPKLIRTAKTENSLFFIQELIVGAPLHLHVPRGGIRDHGEVIFYFAQILKILEYLHAQKIVYRDVKLSNFIVLPEGKIYICDFGAAKRMQQTQGISETGAYGTKHAMAPEILSGSSHGFEADFWSLGILLFELIEGRPPWRDGFPTGEAEVIVPFTESKHTVESKNLITRLLEFNVSVRLCNFAQIRSHAFLRTASDPPALNSAIAKNFIFGEAEETWDEWF